MEEVFERLLDSVGARDEDRAAIMAALARLKARYPNETPARLLGRARREGAPVPTSRCNHGVARGECVVCDKRIGRRWYFTAGGSHLHTTPTCPALIAGQDKVERRGGDTAPIEVVRVQAESDIRDLCSRCVAPTKPSTPRATRGQSGTVTAVRRPASPLFAPAELRVDAPPNVGDGIDWGGFSGVVTGIVDRGVTLSVDGITLTAPWGDRATVRRKA